MPDELVAIRTEQSFWNRAARRLVKASGYDLAWLAVAPGNARARRFYERSGWVDEGLFDYRATTETGTVSLPCHRYVKA